jgi:hypothetical protein
VLQCAKPHAIVAGFAKRFIQTNSSPVSRRGAGCKKFPFRSFCRHVPQFARRYVRCTTLGRCDRRLTFTSKAHILFMAASSFFLWRTLNSSACGS